MGHTLLISLVGLLSTVAVITRANELVYETTPEEEVGDCTCAQFLITDSAWTPEFFVFSTGEFYNSSCSESGAHDRCKAFCDQETTNIEKIFSQYPSAQTEYPPQQSLPCSVLPAPTATFYRSCGSSWIALFSSSYSHVCCHPITNLPVWCDSIPAELYQQLEANETPDEGRGLDLEKSPNDIENNEIEGSTKPLKTDVLISNESGSVASWSNAVMSYFGYNSLSDLVKGFDIFSLPKRFRAAVRTYKDEVNMGQCYMEFTTYSIFTKGENPFEFFSRTKRDLTSMDEWRDFYYGGSGERQNIEKFQREGEDGELLDVFGRSSESKQAQIETIKSLVGSMVSMLERSDTTKNYAKVIQQLLPVVTRVYAADDPQQAVKTLVSLVLGPYLEKINGKTSKTSSSELKKPGSTELTKKKDKLKNKTVIPAPPPIPSLSSGGGSPIASMLLSLVRQYMGSYFQSLAGAPQKSSVETNEISEKVDGPAASAPPLIPGNLINLVNLFLGGASNPRPRPTKATTTTTKPSRISEKQDELIKSELERPKDFVDVILELVRPVFISILGRAPGDSGVASIREVSRLSVLGRVDDVLAEEVLSPFFCFKTYAVNKAWSVTERTLRNVVSQMTPEEQETFRSLIT